VETLDQPTAIPDDRYDRCHAVTPGFQGMPLEQNRCDFPVHLEGKSLPGLRPDRAARGRKPLDCLAAPNRGPLDFRAKSAGSENPFSSGISGWSSVRH
jgi:hypothetical protein